MNATQRLAVLFAAAFATIGLIHAQLPVGCKGKTRIGNRVVFSCHYSGCNNKANLGYLYSATCTTWCCPDGSQEYDPSTCTGIHNTGDCCPVNTEPWVPNFRCTSIGG